MSPETTQDRVLVLAPTGRDASTTCEFLRKANLRAEACELAAVAGELGAGAGVVLAAEEAFLGRDVEALVDWVEHQPPWSDILFLVMTSDREAPSIAEARERLMKRLRNVSLIERPVQPVTLLSAVRSALRARLHQYEVRAHIRQHEEAEEHLEHAVDERTLELQSSNLRLKTEMGERAKAEEALRQSQKMEAVGQLTGGVAHDFNNLLTVISASVEFLQRPNLPEVRRKRYIDAIRETTDRAAILTSQLLAFARRQPLKADVFDTVVEAPRTVEMLRTLLGERVEVKMDLAGEGCFTSVDKSQFETAIVNLAVNARDAMDGQGRLTVTVREADGIPRMRSHPSRAGSFVSISVGDSGAGIPADKIGRIFEPFYTTKAVGKGTGLGLSQVYGFVKQSGGEISVESTLGEGATFTLYLPRVDPPPLPAEAAMPQDRALDTAAGRILVVEDNPQVGEFAAQLLGDLGYTTTWASDADSALELIKVQRGAFDLVFSDVIMPGELSGVDLAVMIKDQWPELPVVLTTGYSDVLAEGGGAGFEILRKPYSVEALSHLIGEVLWRKASHSPSDQAIVGAGA